jgi:predicted transcriptional regulator
MNEKFMMVSIKPKFVEKIIEGEKLIELRKCKPNVNNGDYLIIYATTPIKAVVAYAKIKSISYEPISDFWFEHGDKTGISFNEYQSYYNNQSHAVGIEFEDLQILSTIIELDTLRRRHGIFNPPQTFKYLEYYQVQGFLN